MLSRMRNRSEQVAVQNFALVARISTRNFMLFMGLNITVRTFSCSMADLASVIPQVMQRNVFFASAASSLGSTGVLLSTAKHSQYKSSRRSLGVVEQSFKVSRGHCPLLRSRWSARSVIDRCRRFAARTLAAFCLGLDMPRCISSNERLFLSSCSHVGEAPQEVHVSHQ